MRFRNGYYVKKNKKVRAKWANQESRNSSHRFITEIRSIILMPFSGKDMANSYNKLYGSIHIKFRTESIIFCYVICSRYENEITCSWKLIIVIIAAFIYLHTAVWNVHSSCGIILKLAALFIVIARHLVLKSLLALETVPSWNLNHNILS